MSLLELSLRRGGSHRSLGVSYGLLIHIHVNHRDFTQTDLLSDLYRSLETGLMGKENEAAMYIGVSTRALDQRPFELIGPSLKGTSLRELVHKFRHRTLTLVKMLMLQKRVSEATRVSQDVVPTSDLRLHS